MIEPAFNIDQLIDVRSAPVWVRVLLFFIKKETCQVPGWQYYVETKALIGKRYFIRAYILPGGRKSNES